jgi:hypothetical protein
MIRESSEAALAGRQDHRHLSWFMDRLRIARHSEDKQCYGWKSRKHPKMKIRKSENPKTTVRSFTQDLLFADLTDALSTARRALQAAKERAQRISKKIQENESGRALTRQVTPYRSI